MFLLRAFINEEKLKQNSKLQSLSSKLEIMEYKMLNFAQDSSVRQKDKAFEVSS